MNTLIALVVWITVNGFPVESFESCAVAQTKAAELQTQFPDLQVRAECDAAHRQDAKATIDYYGPRREVAEADDSE